MRNDSDTLEVALIQNMIRTIRTHLKVRPQLVCYFYDDKNEPYYVLLIAITPFRDGYTIYRLDENISLKLNGNLLEIEQFKAQFLALKNGKRVLNWIRNIKTAYIKMKTEYYMEEFL